MMNHVWYHGTIKRYIVLFGTLFNQIYITRTESGVTTSMMRVPIVYGPADKVIKRATLDPDLDRPFSSVLPYMTFQMLKLRYDAPRRLQNQGRIVKPVADNKNLAAYVYNSVPYNFVFELDIITKNAEDGIKILEQILPFFGPTWTATVRIIDEPVMTADISVSFLDHQIEDSWTGSFEERRYIRHTLQFELKGWLFGPISTGKVTKKFIGNFSTDGGEVDAQVSVYPGLTATGEPTSDPTQTIDYTEINWEDDFGYVTERTIGGEDA